MNLLSAFFSTVAIIFFALTLRTLRFRLVFLASFALASVPILFIHGLDTIDYNFALAFMMMAFYFLVRENLVWSGIFMGLAIGCRLTSGALMVPFIIMALQTDGMRNNLVRVFRFAFPALLVGICLFIPVYQKYGMDFFSFYNIPYPSIQKVLYKFSIEVWGLIGTLGILVSVCLFFFPQKPTSQRYLFPRSVNEKYVVAWLIALDLYIIAYIKVPMEAGYLIPMIPFLILLFGKYLYSRAFTFFCVTLIVSPFLFGISPVNRLDSAPPSAASVEVNLGGERLSVDALKGPVLTYQSRTKAGVDFSQAMLRSLDTVSVPSVLVAGRWYNELNVLQENMKPGKMEIRSYLDEKEAVFYFAKGLVIYYLPKQDFFNQVMRNTDLHIYGAIPYISGEKY